MLDAFLQSARGASMRNVRRRGPWNTRAATRTRMSAVLIGGSAGSIDAEIGRRLTVCTDCAQDRHKVRRLSLHVNALIRTNVAGSGQSNKSEQHQDATLGKYHMSIRMRLGSAQPSRREQISPLVRRLLQSAAQSCTYT